MAIALYGDAPRFLRASVAVAVIALAAAALHLLASATTQSGVAGGDALTRAAEIVAQSPQARANLALLRDKRILFHPAGDGFVMFGIVRRSWVVLGDPIGPFARWRDLLCQLITDATSQGGCWQIEVADTGSGIAPVHLPRIFDRFYTGDRVSGSGLGMMMKIHLPCVSGCGKRSAFSIGGAPHENDLAAADGERLGLAKRELAGTTAGVGGRGGTHLVGRQVHGGRANALPDGEDVPKKDARIAGMAE